MLGNRFHHEVRAIANVGECSEENGTHRDGFEEWVGSQRSHFSCRCHGVEDHSCRRIVEECREQARAIHILPRLTQNGLNLIFHLLEEHERGSHRAEDAEEDACHFEDRRPAVVVVDAHFLLGGDPACEDDEDEHPFAKQTEVPRRAMSHRGDVGCIDEHRRCNHAEQPEDIDESGSRHFGGFVYVGHQVNDRLFLIEVGIHAEIHKEKQNAGNEPFSEHVLHPPSEACTFLEKEEEWGITEGRQQTAAVSHDSDEKQDGMHAVFALLDSS